MIYSINIGIIILITIALFGGGGGAPIIGIIVNFYLWYTSDSRLIKKYDVSIIMKGKGTNANFIKKEKGKKPLENPSQIEIQLYYIVEKLSHQAGIPMPKVGISETWNDYNACTIGRSRRKATIFVTRRLLHEVYSKFEYEELEAIIAHELGHVINRDVSVMTWASTFSYLTIPLTYPLSRYREFKADEVACKITKEPKYLISALDKLDSYIIDHRIKDIFVGRHPKTIDRIKNIMSI